MTEVRLTNFHALKKVSTTYGARYDEALELTAIGYILFVVLLNQS